MKFPPALMNWSRTWWETASLLCPGRLPWEGGGERRGGRKGLKERTSGLEDREGEREGGKKKGREEGRKGEREGRKGREKGGLGLGG